MLRQLQVGVLGELRVAHGYCRMCTCTVKEWRVRVEVEVDSKGGVGVDVVLLQ